MSFHPCNECGNEVRPRHQALQCDNCGYWQHRICGTGIDQAIYRLAIIRGRTDSLCVACSLAASNPGDQVPAAESTRTDFAQGTEILSPLFVPEINLFLTKNLTFLAWVLSWTFFPINEFTIRMRFYFCFADLSPVYLPFYLLIQPLHRESSVCTVQVRLVNARKLQRIQRKKYRALQARVFGY